MVKEAVSIDKILKTLPVLTKMERKRLLESLCAYPDVLEDLHDILIVKERRREATRTYQEFVGELRAEGRL
ncbi:MAG: hypothetical protein HYU29_02815 [Chloroflexi bacterium]|nr:hypothetical protein [Chloroflexota bacterium]